jgi:hypothetical protein
MHWAFHWKPCKQKALPEAPHEAYGGYISRCGVHGAGAEAKRSPKYADPFAKHWGHAQ